MPIGMFALHANCWNYSVIIQTVKGIITIKVNIWSLWTWLLHIHALEIQLCTNVLSSELVHEIHQMSNHNNIYVKRQDKWNINLTSNNHNLLIIILVDTWTVPKDTVPTNVYTSSPLSHRTVQYGTALAQSVLQEQSAETLAHWQQWWVVHSLSNKCFNCIQCICCGIDVRPSQDHRVLRICNQYK